jgi:hypothetical protein
MMFNSGIYRYLLYDNNIEPIAKLLNVIPALSVIPAQPGIQSFQDVLDPHLRGGDERVFRGGDEGAYFPTPNVPRPLRGRGYG